MAEWIAPTRQRTVPITRSGTGKSAKARTRGCLLYLQLFETLVPLPRPGWRCASFLGERTLQDVSPSRLDENCRTRRLGRGL